jgi:hypothetical protein
MYGSRTDAGLQLAQIEVAGTAAEKALLAASSWHLH